MRRSVEMPNALNVRATQVVSPPAWALLQRQLIDLMTESAALLCDKYTECGGALYYADDVDDLYEPFHNFATCAIDNFLPDSKMLVLSPVSSALYSFVIIDMFSPLAQE